MRILLLGHEDICSLYAMDRVIRALPEHDFVVRFSISKEPDGSGLEELERHDLALCGRFRATRDLPPALQAARALPNPNSVEGLADLRANQPDLIVSIRYHRFLKEEAIAVPPLGVLNLHSGILPDYRGVMATFWSMLHGDETIGATLHRIVDSSVDTGPVVAAFTRSIRSDRSYLSNVLGLFPEAADCIIQAITDLGRGQTLTERPQDPKAGAYFSVPDFAAVERFLAQGQVLFDGRESEEWG